jgi:hypothetical protein
MLSREDTGYELLMSRICPYNWIWRNLFADGEQIYLPIIRLYRKNFVYLHT